MLLTIFGATGKTGRLLVDRALNGGHEIRAFGRNLAAITTEHPKLARVRGDVLDEQAVADAVLGADAVLSALGGVDSVRAATSGKQRAARQIYRGTASVVGVMERAGPRRLIWLSSRGVGESRADSGWLFQYVIIPLALKQEFADKERQEELIRRSRLDWTLVRPSVLTDGPRTGKYRVAERLKLGARARVARADLAEFMIEQLAQPAYVRKAVTISD